MNYTHKDARNETADALTAVSAPIARALDAATKEIASWADMGVIDALFMMDRTCPLDPEDDIWTQTEAIIRQIIAERASKISARDDTSLDIHLHRPDPTYRADWLLVVMDGQVTVIARNFPTFESGKAAFDTMAEFIRMSGREGQFTYETPRPDGCTVSCVDGDELPF